MSRSMTFAMTIGQTKSPAQPTRRGWAALAAGLLLFASACHRLTPTVAVDAAGGPGGARPDVSTAGPVQQMLGAPFRPDAAAGHHAVATAHPLATQAAEAALQAGGTAVDALVAASMMLTVVTPQSTGIGGGGFALIWPGSEKPAEAWDFRETAPAATDRKDYLDSRGVPVPAKSQRHGLAVATPGYVAGLWALHQRHGKLPWKDVVLPAARAAEQGVLVTPQLAAAIELSLPDLHRSARALFAPDGQPLRAGDRLVWPKLAATLRLLAEQGGPAFYTGPIAADVAASAQAAGGKLAVTDLQHYTPRQLAPLVGTLFGRSTLTMPQPSAGGAQVLAMGEFLDRWLHKSSRADAVQSAHALAEAMRRSFALRLAFSGDPEAPAQTLDGAFPASARAALADGWDATRAVPTHALPTLLPAKPSAEKHDNTSHVSIADGQGMTVSATHTVNLLLGAGIVAEQTGILLNNEMDDFAMSETASNAFGLAGSKANLVRPGARPVSSMSPLLVLEAGQPILAVGSPGGTRIPTSVLQVVYWHLVIGERLRDAVAHFRVHHQALPDVASVEQGSAGDAVASGLTRLGHTVVRRAPWCNVQAVRAHRLGDGRIQWEAVADPRGEGAAIAR